MESAKYTNKEVVQAIQELDFGEDTCSINCYIQRRMQNHDISEITKMVTVDSAHNYFCRKKFFHDAKIVCQGRTETFKVENGKEYMILRFNFFTW